MSDTRILKLNQDSSARNLMLPHGCHSSNLILLPEINRVGRNLGSGGQAPWRESQLCGFLAVQPCACFLTSLGFCCSLVKRT